MPRIPPELPLSLALLFSFTAAMAGEGGSPTTLNGTVEWTVASAKTYTDPFNDVDVDVVFERDGQTWRVPTFWRGASRWTVRFAPPVPGDYTYHLESTDRDNPDLNGHAGKVTIPAYTGANDFLRRGMLRVSANKRYFEQADGTPFYWLGDTWWTGLSTRLSWEGFQKLTADRKAKGFTVVQIVAGLVPTEEQAPSDPGYCNEGGCAWEPHFTRINPHYFDSADRRIEHLVDNGIAPAIVGAWSEKLAEMGADKLKKHWRYVIARYGAYPVFWILGGEVSDPPEDVALRYNQTVGPADRLNLKLLGGWSSVARYIRQTDPLHHPLTVHEYPFADDLPLQQDALTDFQMFQSSHFGWPSIAVEVAQLDTHYARTAVTKPLVQGEIGYERLGEIHLEDFQRVAFWLTMLNGAAGHTYGANGAWEAYTPDKPFQRLKWSMLTWEEGMSLPGSYQIGLGAKLLQHYRWWQFQPHPEWVTPRGTTLLEPRGGLDRFHIDISGEVGDPGSMGWANRESEWHKRRGDFRRPYAAGIPGEVRFVYIPYFGLFAQAPPTLQGLEPGVRYHAYFWEPSLGIKYDLGAVERSPLGKMLSAKRWTDDGETISVAKGVNETNVTASVDAHGNTDAGLLLRFHDAGHYLAAVYSAKDRSIRLFDRNDGVDGAALGDTPAPDLGPDIKLTAEVRGRWGIVSVTDGTHTYTSEIVQVGNTTAGGVGVLHPAGGGTQSFAHLAARRADPPVLEEHLQRKLYDAQGGYRGELSGGGLPILTAIGVSSWSDFGKEKIQLLDAYRPERLPYGRDWVLVLEKM